MDNKRFQRRSEIRLRCPSRTLDGIPIEIELLDLSERGCHARSIGFPLQFGQSLRLFPEGCEEFTATVRHCEDGICGIEFDRELPIQVFERMRCYVPPLEETQQTDIESEPALDQAALQDGSQLPGPEQNGVRQTYGSLLTKGTKPSSKKMAIS